jgi:CysZ protein
LKGAVFAVCGVFLFVLSFIPVINLLAVAAAMFLLAFDCMDYALEARRLKFRQRLRYVFRNKAQWAGMATGLALTLLLPGLTLLVIPGAVTGAALNLKETDESRTSAPETS